MTGELVVRHPLLTLDAIHLASASIAHVEMGEVGVLSLDERVRANAAALGMTVLPPGPI